MRVGLLLCDHVGPEFLGISGDYEEMFGRLFEDYEDVELVVYDAIEGEMPESPRDCDAWLTTGSRYSVNDDLPWIRELEEFVRRVADSGVPFVGICFGHQLIARALGGTVVKSDRGWGVGVKEVQLVDSAIEGSTVALLNSHQDQVERLPEGATVLGWNEHCPVSVMGVGPSVLGIQGHPEMEPALVEALLLSRRGGLVPEEVADEGLASLAVEPGSGKVAAWIVDFMRAGPRA
jgi:GMP synthase (glutamine-hydrolysing)